MYIAHDTTEDKNMIKQEGFCRYVFCSSPENNAISEIPNYCSIYVYTIKSLGTHADFPLV